MKRKCKKCGTILFPHKPLNGSTEWTCIKKTCNQYHVAVAVDIDTSKMEVQNNADNQMPRLLISTYHCGE